jgi:hypothetical protein
MVRKSGAYDLIVSFADKYDEPRDGPFHFYDDKAARIFSTGFAKCRKRKMGPRYFFRTETSYHVELEWGGIPTTPATLSYYALSLPENAIPITLSIVGPDSANGEYHRSVSRDDQRRRYVIYLECRSHTDLFKFNLSCDFKIDPEQFKFSKYKDSTSDTKLGAIDEYRTYLAASARQRVNEHFTNSSNIGGQSTKDPLKKSKGQKDFFISYNEADRSWAEWIAWNLEEAGHTTVFQDWDFRPGSNFVQKMQEAASESLRTIAVLSPDYLNALFTHSEWQAAFEQDPTGEKGVLVPVRVRVCDLTGLLRQRIFIDLVDLQENRAREVLLRGLERGRAKPIKAPAFPEVVDHSVEKPSTYPGYRITARVTKSKPPQRNKRGKCRPSSIRLDQRGVDEKTQISLDVMQGCKPDDAAFYLLHFVLSEHVDGEFRERVSLEVVVEDRLSDKADQLRKKGLSPIQLEFLSGPVTSRAKRLPAGTRADRMLSKLIMSLLDLR